MANPWISWANASADLPITTAAVIGGCVAKGQTLDSGVTERLKLLTSLQDYYDMCGVTSLDTTKELDKFINLAFNVYGVSPIIIYNVDNTSVVATDIVDGIEAVQNESENKLNKTCFALCAEDSGTEETIRSALDTFTRANAQGRMAYQIDDTETTTAGAISDKSITTREAIATIGSETISEVEYSLDFLFVLTLVKNTTIAGNQGRVFRSVSNTEIPNGTSYSHTWTKAETKTLEENGIMSVINLRGRDKLKGVYTAHYTATGSPDIADDYQATVDTLSQTQNEIVDYIMDEWIDAPTDQALLNSVITQINVNLGNNPGYNPNSKVTAIKNTSSESESKITIYMTTYPKVPATDFDINNNVLVWSFDIELTE